MSNDQVIKFGGDVNSLVGATEKGKRGLNNMDDAAKKAAASAKKLDDRFRQTFAGLAAGVGVTSAFTKALDAAAEAAERVRTAAAETLAKKGSEAVDVERAILETQVATTPAQRQSLLGMIGEGTTPAEDTASFLQAFVKKRGRRFNVAEAQRAAEAYTSGAYSQEMLLEARTIPTVAEQQARLDSMSPEARDELEVRRKKRQSEAAVRALAARRQASRFVQDTRTEMQLRSPTAGAILSLAETVPGLESATNDIFEAQARRRFNLGGDATTIGGGDAQVVTPAPIRRSESLQQKLLGNEGVMLMRLVDDQVLRISPTPKPTVIQGPRE